MGSQAISLANLVDGILEAADNKPRYLKIFLNWRDVVGENIASKSMPYRVITSGTRKVLILKTKKGCSLEIQHQSYIILEKIHDFLKEQFFDQLKVMQMDINDQIS